MIAYRYRVEGTAGFSGQTWVCEGVVTVENAGEFRQALDLGTARDV